jgi:DNA-binding MarR family transcriptional regulator
MNAERPSPPGAEHYRSLQILDELSNNDSLTQRDLSSRLGIALGLVNSYIKNLIKKGFITVKAIPTKRYAYYLTPKGFTEKTRLTYDLLHDYTRVYREARRSFKQLFHELEASGMTTVIFAGADEIAEIAYITLQETDLKLVGVVDPDKADEMFFGRKIEPMTGLNNMEYDSIVVTSYLKRESLHRALLDHGIVDKNIREIFAIRR